MSGAKQWLPGVLWLALLPWPASAQVYCSRWAELVDAPSNVRRAPDHRAAISCRLQPNGLSLLVYPVRSGAEQRASSWMATMACRSGGQQRAIGLGQTPDYIHKSQIRLLGINRDDWFEGSDGPESGPCGKLWRP